jgi:hypothetical protein
MLKTLQPLFLVFLLMLVFSSPGHADEGMWMPHQMKGLNLEAEGLKMNPDDLYKKDGTGLMSAVVHLGGGTGEFVSPHGLILTNHHVAFGALQRASDKDHDYIQNGFLAGSMDMEIPAKGYIADVLIGYEDVTQTILEEVKPGMTPLQRYKAIEKIEKRIIAKEERKANDRRCEVKSMYSGNKYYLFKFKRLRDIRLVYAPPHSIGNFGGDIDNWMWPRHTGDFSFLRAYVSKENSGIEYHKDNVPYKPTSSLNVSIEGLNEGDFTFVMGYPGTTYRNYTLSEFQYDIDKLKKRIQWIKEILAFLGKTIKDNRALQIKYARLDKGLNNALKNFEAKLEGLQKAGVIDKKRSSEKKYLQWVTQEPTREKRYGTILKKIETFMEKYGAFDRKNTLINTLTNRYIGAALLSQACLIYRTAVERQKPDIEREPGFQKRDLPEIKMGIKLAERGYELDTDKAYLKFLLKSILKEPMDDWPIAFKPILEKGADAIEHYVDTLYANTTLMNPKKRLNMLKQTPDQLLKLNDSFIALAANIEKELKNLREKENALDQERNDLKKVFMEAVLAKHEGRIAPDANSSIRFTYGTVNGYHPKDAVVYAPFTTLKGVMEKETGEFPFIVPEKLKKLYNAKDFGRYADKNLGDIAICFLNTTNVTGGNSGSPVLNAKGEQVGIVFDMTYESVIGDYFIIPEFQRTIHVDIRYVLFITEKFSGALHLVKEMGL